VLLTALAVFALAVSATVAAAPKTKIEPPLDASNALSDIESRR